MDNLERVYAQIDLSAIRHNYGVMKQTFPGKKIMSVLKADAYGHGVPGILPACDQGTDYYAVATFEEAKAIRQWGSHKPVLLLGPLPMEKMAPAATLGLTLTIGSLDYAKRVSAMLEPLDLQVDCHLKIDTGMNRAGFRWRESCRDQALEEITQVFSMKSLRFTGTYTHLCCADSEEPEDMNYTAIQFRRFEEACKAMQAKGLPLGIRHCCATGGSILHPDFQLDMIRTGMMVYGNCDTIAHYQQLGLRQAMTWKSHVIQIEDLSAGEPVGYARTFRAEKDMLVAIVSCGYADGYRRNYQSWGTVLVGGKRTRIIGRICMDYLMIDLTDIPCPKAGMEVVLLGSQGNEEITAMEFAEAVGSVCGEVTGALSARVPRYYING